ncbi:MAG: HAD-IA family hydrolase [Candidatus Latescibacterota bacterium]|jgi:HAD superfamily hydrolase (TIGR01549 family)
MIYRINNIKAVLFDMDGTLTVPNIDWKELRARVGVAEGVGIMEHIYALSGVEARRADLIVRETEMTSVCDAVANQGLGQLFDQLENKPWKRALITNNHREAMERVVSTFDLRFDLLMSREDAPLKPAPDLLLLALERFEISPEEAVFIGDGRYDREASAAAGVRYIHLENDRSKAPEGEVIYGLEELMSRLGSA